jgi:uncharacterized membrane protein
MGDGRSALALAALLASAGSHASAQHKIAFQLCNDTIVTAFFAVAYEGARASRTAQGWTKVNPGRCNVEQNVALPPGGWFSYYVITQNGKNYHAGPNDLGELICARPDDFSLDRAAAADRLGSSCPAGYDMLNFRKVDAADVKSGTYTVRLTEHGVIASR